MSAEPARRRVAVVTGSRADFGLLRPVMDAVIEHPDLDLLAIAAGAHLIAPAATFRDVKSAYHVADSVPMQVAGRDSRLDEAEALGRGVVRFARAFERLAPDWVVVLGDRIEALAAGSAASVGGIALAHIHGGDRAEGIADEAVRHAVTKLAHLHFPATPASAERLRRLGERPKHVLTVGSPAIDALGAVAPMADRDAAELGDPTVVLLLHPSGLPADRERALADAVGQGLLHARERVLWLHPNHDPGRGIIMSALSDAAERAGWHALEHLPRERFVALLKRLAATPMGVMVGNSSAGLIEAAALRLPVLNLGPRQNGRERAGNALDLPESGAGCLAQSLPMARALDRSALTHPYGRGDAGIRIAEALARIDPRDPALVRKCCAY